MGEFSGICVRKLLKDPMISIIGQFHFRQLGEVNQEFPIAPGDPFFNPAWRIG